MNITNRFYCLSSASVLLCLHPLTAEAHLATTRFGEFYSGLLHPAISLVHVLPWLAFALLAGLHPPHTARQALWVFPISVLFGVVVGTFVGEWSLIQGAVIASFGAALLVTLGKTFGPRNFLIILSVAGVVHGLANAAPMADGQNLVLYWGGVGVFAYIVIALISASTYVLINKRSWGIIAVRAAGSWILAIGMMHWGVLTFVPNTNV